MLLRHSISNGNVCDLHAALVHHAKIADFVGGVQVFALRVLARRPKRGRRLIGGYANGHGLEPFLVLQHRKGAVTASTCHNGNFAIGIAQTCGVLNKAKFANVRGQPFNGFIIHNAARVEVRQIKVSERDLLVCDCNGFAIYVHGFDP